MLSFNKYKNKKIAIYGMGLTGFSATKIFKKLKAEVYCWDDSKKVREKLKKKNFEINKFWLNKKNFDKILISPGIDINKCKINNFLKKNSNKLITDLDVFFELNKRAMCISITGTNGKSTTCKLMEKILKTAGYRVKTIGNIGNPVLLSKNTKKKYIFIIEVSSYQLQYSKKFRSKHAAILNISPDHLDRHKSIKNYTKIKSKIFFGQKKTDYSYINQSKKYSKSIKKIFKKKKLNSNLILVKKIDKNVLLKKVNNKYFKSRGNIENLAFAYEIAKKLNIRKNTIIKAANKFKALPHRQEIIFSKKKILCINDSKATSFDSSLQSLSSYNKIYWILGGLPKYRDQFNLKSVKKNIIKAYVIGKNISFFKKKIEKDVLYKVSKSIKNAISDIHKDIKLNKSLSKTILFSPAAASFDQFKNFEDRGEQFKKLVVKKFYRGLNV